MSFKIAFIGAGSLVFARTLFTDIISVPEFHNIEIAFTDINPDNLEKTRELCQRDLDANNIPIRIEATTNRRDAFKDARYIVNCVRIGGLEGFETDVEIPLKYGIDQCVGDTLCTIPIQTQWLHGPVTNMEKSALSDFVMAKFTENSRFQKFLVFQEKSWMSSVPESITRPGTFL